MVHTRMTYSWDKILFGQRFQDVLGVDEDGTRFLDYGRFDETYDAPPSVATKVAQNSAS